MIQGASYRGQPLVAFLLVVGGWVAMRVMAWDAGMAGAGVVLSEEPILPVEARASAPVTASPLSVPWTAASVPSAIAVPGERAGWTPPHAQPRPGRTARLAVLSRMPAGQGDLLLASADRRGSSLLSQPNVPMPLAATAPGRPRDARWSADGWLLARSGGIAQLPGGLAPPSYGASQMGAVLRYRLATQSAHRPTLYLRGSAALNGSREREAAFGFSARPLSALPIALAAEARVNGQPGRTRLRPAALAYTELPPIDLPLRTRAELYGQAGYVGGNFASAFADGQVRLEHRLAEIGPGELRAGGGAWGGAQKGASRLDLGPTATLAMPVGDAASARLAVDWRFRVTGNAAPSSGPALTLSAGF